jgi:hypothetical protein
MERAPADCLCDFTREVQYRVITFQPRPRAVAGEAARQIARIRKRKRLSRLSEQVVEGVGPQRFDFEFACDGEALGGADEPCVRHRVCLRIQTFGQRRRLRVDLQFVIEQPHRAVASRP